MPKLIVLFGPQRAGKSSAANSLCYHEGFVRVAFADPLYDMLDVLLGGPEIDIRSLPKDKPMPELNNQTLRHALQTLGTEWGRNLMGSDFWVNKACLTITDFLSQGVSVVVDDCRFTSEYAAMKAAGANMIEISRADLPEQENPDHGSEIEWKSFERDALILNDCASDVDWLENASDLILQSLRVRS
jgi:hypothetical protein